MNLLFIVIVFLLACANAERTKIVAISDVHLLSESSSKDSRAKLHDFLYIVANSKDIHTLVLNGDIIDLWDVPCNQKPPSIEEILKNQQIIEFADDIKEVLRNEIRVVYVLGNHDMKLTEKHIHQIFGPGVIVASKSYTEKQFDVDIEFSHGHLKDAFNQPNPLMYGFPFGYFVTRLNRCCKCPRINSNPADESTFTGTSMLCFVLTGGICAIPFHLVTTNMASMIVSACLDNCHRDDVEIQLTNRRVGIRDIAKSFDAKLKNSHPNNDELMGSINVGRYGNYKYFMENLSANRPRIQVRGHTHLSLQHQYVSVLSNKPIHYVNLGSWGHGEDRAYHFAVFENGVPSLRTFPEPGCSVGPISKEKLHSLLSSPALTDHSLSIKAGVKIAIRTFGSFQSGWVCSDCPSDKHWLRIMDNDMTKIPRTADCSWTISTHPDDPEWLTMQNSCSDSGGFVGHCAENCMCMNANTPSTWELIDFTESQGFTEGCPEVFHWQSEDWKSRCQIGYCSDNYFYTGKRTCHGEWDKAPLFELWVIPNPDLICPNLPIFRQCTHYHEDV